MLGTEYIVPSYPPIRDSFYSLVGFIAAEDNTNVSVTLKTTGTVTYKGKEYGNGETITEVIHDLGMFQIGSTKDLTGSRVVSSKPVAVFSGNDMNGVVHHAVIGHMVEQIPPLSHWGTHFVTSPAKTRTVGDIYRVLAAFDETSVVSNNIKSVLQQGDLAEYDVTANDAREIECDKRCLVVQYNKGYPGDYIDTDPFMMILPPTNKYTSNARLPTPLAITNEQFSTFINIVIKTSDSPELLVDDQSRSLTWDKIPGTNFSRTSIRATKPYYKISHQSEDARFLSFVYGRKLHAAFGYPGGYNSDGTTSSKSPTPKNCRVTVRFPNDINQTCRDSITANVTGLPSVEYNLCTDNSVSFTMDDTFTTDARCPNSKQVLQRKFTGVDSFGREFIHVQKIISFPTSENTVFMNGSGVHVSLSMNMFLAFFPFNLLTSWECFRVIRVPPASQLVECWYQFTRFSRVLQQIM